MANQTPGKIPEWLSLRDIAVAWSEETGESAEALEAKFREWFKEFLVRNAYAEAGAGGGGDDAEIPAEMLEGRQIWRETFETFCEERGHAKPRFWFPEGRQADRPAETPTAAAVAAESEEVSAAPAQAKPKPPPRKRARARGASFTRISLALAVVVTLGLVAGWVLDTGGRVAERDASPRSDAQQLAATTPSPEPAPATPGPAESNGPRTTTSVPAAIDQPRPSASAAPAKAGETPIAALAPATSGGLSTAESPGSADEADGGLILMIQRELETAGFDPGPLDGRSGPKFSDAIGAYQRARNIPVDSRVSIDLLSRLARENLERGRLELSSPKRDTSPVRGGVADKGAGAPVQQGALPRLSTTATSAPRGGALVRSIQKHLAARGYYSGPLDGNLGPKTRKAIETYQRAQRYETNGRPSRALYEELENYALDVRGLAFFQEGAYDAAIATYSRIIRRRPKNANAFFNRGLAYKNIGFVDRALADYDAAIRLDPWHQKAHLDRGNIRYEKGLYREAIRDYLSALELWLGLR
jgi:peptidoglycan hydrolase-like protein with peptidoglycan-binding domain